MGVTVAEVIAVLDAAYPRRLAEPWDTGIGLTCGDPAALVERVLLAVDVDPVTVAEARERGAGLLLTHHPLLFRPVQSVAADTGKGALVHTLIRAGIAQFSAHTNADRAVGGVNDALAAVLGLRETVPLVPAASDDPREGLGRVGTLPEPVTLGEFAARVAAALPDTAQGVRFSGDASRPVSRVAVCGGSGSSEIDAARVAGADVYLTSDVTHHTAQEHDAGAGPALVEVAHWAGEWPWLPVVARLIAEAFGGRVETLVSTVRTDAWSGLVPSPGAQQ